MFVDILTREQAICNLVNRFIKRRKSMKITQKKLAERTMVSYASIRRFETTGEISLSSLMRLALALDCLEDFEKLFANEFIFDLEDL